MSRLFGFAVEPQTGCDFLNVLHGISSTPGKSSLCAPCFTAIYRISVACGFKAAQMEWPWGNSWSSDQISQGKGFWKLADAQHGTRGMCKNFLQHTSEEKSLDPFDSSSFSYSCRQARE